MSVKIVLCAQQSSDWVSRLLDLQPGLTVADLKAYAAKFLAPEVSEIYIENPRRLAGGGSNGSRVRLWKRELQKLANELGLDIVVSHLPPGTFISQNWRARPLVSYRVIVELISATTTKTGLTVRREGPMPRSPPSTSNGQSSTASGTTPSHRIPIR